MLQMFPRMLLKVLHTDLTRCFHMRHAEKVASLSFLWRFVPQRALRRGQTDGVWTFYKPDSDQRGTKTVPEKQLAYKCPNVFDIDVLVELLRQENASDVCVIRVPEDMKYSDYFVIVSGSSTRHLLALAEYAIKVYKSIRHPHNPHVRIEGKDSHDWMCIDFGSMVVHFMLPETRRVYELEKLWTLRSYDEQLRRSPPDILPKDFICDEECFV